MTLVMTMEVRNEVDAIEEYITHHLASGVAGMVIADRDSTDGTDVVLARLARTLPLVVIDRVGEFIDAKTARERMTRLAVDRLGASWTLHGYIDEYWMPTDGGLGAVLGAVPVDVSEVLIPVVQLTGDPDHPDDLPDPRVADDDRDAWRVIHRCDGSVGERLWSDEGTCAVGLVPPRSDSVARNRAIAWGIEHHLGLDGRRAASPRWKSLFEWYVGDSGESAVTDIDRAVSAVDQRIADALRSFDPSQMAPIATDARQGESGTSLVVVAGMHRSGTSLIARVVNLLGVDIGDEAALMEAKPDNPTGFWENRSFAGLDDDLLAALGGRWDQPPTTALDWPYEPGLDPFRERASRLITDTFSAGSMGLVKDPRMSITLPFWATVAPIHATLLVLRHPSSVAASLQRRDGMDLEHAAGLWIDYTLAVLDAAHDCQVVLYDEFLSDPVESARSLASSLGLDSPTPDIVDEIASFADPGLRHHHDASTPGAVGPKMVDAADLFNSIVGGDQGRILMHRSAHRRQCELSTIAHDLDRIETEWALAQRTIERLTGERDRVWEDRDRGLAEIERLIGERDRVWEDRDRGLAQIEQLQRRLEIQDMELLDLENVSGGLADRLDTALGRADAAEARIEILEGESIIARSLRRLRQRRSRGTSP